jgi:hypothetical protein
MPASSDAQNLVDDQLIDRFDYDYFGDGLLDRVLASVDGLRSEVRTIADFGGGNGRLLDRVLARYPQAHGTNYEISERLRALNTASSRKTVSAKSFLVLEEASAFDSCSSTGAAPPRRPRSPDDHRLIESAAEAPNAPEARRGACRFGNLLYSVIPERFSSAALFAVTRSRLLKPIVSRMHDGKAIAGVGIYYMSEPRLRGVFARLEHVATLDQNEHDYGWKLRLVGIRRVAEKVLVFRKPGERK